jgi:hypothetical protein
MRDTARSVGWRSEEAAVAHDADIPLSRTAINAYNSNGQRSTPTRGLCNHDCGARNFGGIWSACGYHEVQCTSIMSKYTHIYVHMQNCTCEFDYISCSIQKILIITGIIY